MSGTIDRHRSDIEKKIHLLENRLQDTAKYAELSLPFTKDHTPLKEVYYDAKRNLQDRRINYEQRTMPLKSSFNNTVKPGHNDHVSLRSQHKNQEQNCRRDSQQKRKDSLKANRKTARELESNSELLEMMKTILQGQKQIQQQLNQLRQSNVQGSRKNQSEIKEEADVQENNNNPNKIDSVHQSLLAKPPAKSRAVSEIRGKTGSVRKNREDRFEELVNLIKNQRNCKERIQVSEEHKKRVWREVEQRMRESDHDYKDTIHRNIKHEHQHLTNTYDLQRKLRDELTAKVFGHCSKFYK